MIASPELDRAMAKRRTAPEPMGPILAENLLRFGMADIVVRATDLANLIREKTGKRMSRQRISAIVNAIRVEPDTIRTIADALGVEPEELLKR